jgi:biotin carboxylase
MKLTYDQNLKIAGIGLVPWSRLGPEKWFDNYKIASLYGWDVTGENVPEVHALHDIKPDVQLDKLNTPHLLADKTFQEMLKANFDGYKLLTYKPVEPVEQLKSFQFLTTVKDNGGLEGRLENKALFRELMQGEGIPFPKYKTFNKQEIAAMDAEQLLQGRDSVILQDEALSGGKGTFVVSDADTLRYALYSIERMGSGAHLVVSERIIGAHERSVQCCATRYGVFVGPLQKQIIADPLLANLRVADGDKFCGAEISSSDAFASAYPEIKQYAQTIGNKIQSMGYRGIFSVDCLIDGAGKIYVLEINPRITGITPLLTMLYREGQDIPFYLLHILELAGADYTIEDDYVDATFPEGSLMVLHSQSLEKTTIVKTPYSGFYNPITVQFEKTVGKFDVMHGQPQLLVQQYIPNVITVKPGGRMLTVFTNGRVLDDDDRLTTNAKRQIKQLNSKIEVKLA